MDWKVVTTASLWRQLSKNLWPEVHKWSRQIDWTKLGMPRPRHRAAQATATPVPARSRRGQHAANTSWLRVGDTLARGVRDGRG